MTSSLYSPTPQRPATFWAIARWLVLGAALLGSCSSTDLGVASGASGADAIEAGYGTGLDLASAQVLYAHALSLEASDAYYEALSVYDQLDARQIDYRDAKKRRETLQALVNMVEQEYAAAVEAPSPTLALRHLRLIRACWPEYRDIQDRIRAQSRAVKMGINSGL